MKNKLHSLLVVLSVFVFQSIQCSAAAPVDNEVKLVKEKFHEHVEAVATLPDYEAELVATTKKITRDFEKFEKYPQYFLVVDRNPSKQLIALSFYDPVTNGVSLLGFTKVSTGNPKRLGHYETPVGVFRNLPENMSYRALGTRNSKGWRGFGVKGSRVWDFGWQKSRNFKNPDIDIRMLMHATDPDNGEKRLGTVDSKGCVRIPAKLNSFLDLHGFLDSEFEKAESKKYVLLKNREQVKFAGSILVVIDSSFQ